MVANTVGQGSMARRRRGDGSAIYGEEQRVIFLNEEFLASVPGIYKGPPVHRGVAQPGRAPRLGRGCRQFESGRPDHFISNEMCRLRCTWFAPVFHG